MTRFLQFTFSFILVAMFSLSAAAIDTFTVSWEKPENGDIAMTLFSAEPSNQSGQIVSKGSQVLIEAVPAEGYYTKTLTANGVDIMATRSVTVTEDVEIVAEFEAIPADNYVVRYPVTYHTQVEVTLGSEKVNSGSIVPAGSTVGIRVVPFTGVQVASTTVNGETLSGSSYTVNSNINIAYQLNIPDAGVYVNFDPQAENGYISALKWVNGSTSTIDPAEKKAVFVSQMVWICGIPNSGYIVDEICVNGVPQKLENIDVVNPIFGTVKTYRGVKYPVQYTDINITATFKIDDGTGIDEVSEPSSNYDYTTNTLTANEDVVVYDATGKVVMSVKAGETVSFDSLSSNVYIVKGQKDFKKIIR